MINEKIEEEEVFRAKQAVMEANRDKRAHTSRGSRSKDGGSTTQTPTTPG